MNRRQFLAASAAGTAGVLASTTAAFVGRNVGVGIARAGDAGAVPPRADGVRGRVAEVDGASLAVEIEPTDDVESLRLLAARRDYPGGDELADVLSHSVRLGEQGPSETVDLTVPHEGYRSEPWLYEVFVVRDGQRPAFLCESAPHRWRRRPEYGTTGADRVAAAATDERGEGFDRELTGNDYRLRYRWRDGDDRPWRVDYRIRRSVHDAAVVRKRGYVHTFEESLSNPYAVDLAATIAADAAVGTGGADEGERPNANPAPDPERELELEPDPAPDSDSDPNADLDQTPDPNPDRNQTPDPNAAALSRGEQFDRLVRFVQGLRYARDAETTARYDYNRTVEETLVAGVGDCKDKTHLLAGLLAAPPLSCSTAMLFQPAHVLLGVAAEDVPARFADRETVELGSRAYLPVDGSLRFAVGEYPDRPITAAYADGAWIHLDAGAIVRGIDRNVRDWVAASDGR